MFLFNFLSNLGVFTLLQIYEANQFQIVKKFFMDEEVQKLKWSPDDKFIMSVNVKTCTVHIRALSNDVIEDNLDGWNGHIFEEMLAGACWSADSRQILTFTDL